jgi:hypothetical protein
MNRIPDRTEAADYYFTYIDQVVGSDICGILESQLAEALGLLQSISEEQSLARYAPNKWSIRELVSHVTDTERAFVFRSLWFARGFDTPLASFNPDIAVPAAADRRSWASHVEEFTTVRRATVTFFKNIAPEAFDRRGISGGNPFTVRALAFIAAGHVTHHLKILRERYL